METKYRYRPVLFFVLTYLFTWAFWIPAVFLPEDAGALMMVIGLIMPAVISTLFVVFSGSKALKTDLKNKLVGFYKVKWSNLLISVAVFALIIALSILLSIPFGGSLKQFSFTEDFSFTGVGVGSALLTILLASFIEEIGWKGYCEDSIGNYMNWCKESLLFGAIWSFWHFPLIFIKGTYQAGLMTDPLYVINFFISGIPLGFIITWVYLESGRSIFACMMFHLFVNLMQEKIAMTPDTKCIETIVVTAAAAVIVLIKKDMFFGEDHVGKLPEWEAPA
ncbi:MAG: CPBP family intramembrane metalloprotease [Lachnospiraceae bacterium]|nr:CPBP family intramembrane metalloprotease [Lachnospiraceae bacterium]